MIVKVGLENGFLDRSIAWLLDYPGCTAGGSEGDEALLRVPQALVGWQNWMDKHTEDSWLADLGDFDVRMVERVEKEQHSRIGANWFQADALPLERVEIKRGLQVLAWLRGDLLNVAASFTTAELDRGFEGERWSIRGIVEHIADAEFWYLQRMEGIEGTEAELPGNVFERIGVVRARLNHLLPGWEGVEDVRDVAGERWSPRKILRRAIWHEHDHIEHIVKFMMKM